LTFVAIFPGVPGGGMSVKHFPALPRLDDFEVISAHGVQQHVETPQRLRDGYSILPSDKGSNVEGDAAGLATVGVRITNTYEFYRLGNASDFPLVLDALEFPHHSGFRERPLAILTTKSLAMFVWFFNTRRQLSWSSKFSSPERCGGPPKLRARAGAAAKSVGDSDAPHGVKGVR
jgi:hypothetical protein